MRSEIWQPQKFVVANEDLIQRALFESDSLSDDLLQDLPTYIPDYSEGYADPVCNWG